MRGLDLTYRILVETRNNAAVDALASQLPSASVAARQRILMALASRAEPRAAELLLENWQHIAREDYPALAKKSEGIEGAVARSLETRIHIENAIEAMASLGLTGSFAPLLKIAESDSQNEIRIMATKAVMRLAAKQGKAARQDQGSNMSPVIARLVDSVASFDKHRNINIVDAYLLASSWNDATLRDWLTHKSPIQTLLLDRLARSEHAGVIELLVGYLNRRVCPPIIAKTMLERTDQTTRDSILRAIGSKPSGTTLQHLSEMGIPKSMANPNSIFRVIPEDHRAALVHVYAAGCKDPIQVLDVITEAILRGGPNVIPAASLWLSRCDVPDTEFFMRAAIPVAKSFESESPEAAFQLPHDAKLVRRLIELLSHREISLVKAAKRMLGPLHAENMLPQFDQLRPRSRRRLGRIVTMVDEKAIERVRDSLRHPVLERRLEAIAAADALGSIEVLADSFIRIAREDHQAARVRAAEAMASARDAVTLGLLEEMVRLPESQVRDAASEALAVRQKSRAR
jgi:hypothetical protein